MGEQRAKEFFTKLKANDVQILSGNKQVAQAAASGQIAFGLTDTDDAIGMLEKGEPVAIVYPDREADQMGTLFIPNTVAIIKGCPHPEAARKLVDFLLTPGVEETLAKGPSAQIPLNPAVTVPGASRRQPPCMRCRSTSRPRRPPGTRRPNSCATSFWAPDRV